MPRGLDPDLDARRAARRRDEVDHVEADRLGDVHLLERGLKLDQLRPVDDRLELDLVAAALHPPLEHTPLVLALGVADADPQQEAVELRLRERVGALVLDRVLGREHDERRRERPRLALDRDLPLLHRLEQRGLRLRRGAVDLVGEEEVGEDRARAGTRSRTRRWSKIDEPVTSEGIRSGVNWMREKSMRVTCANERAASVFARPG